MKSYAVGYIFKLSLQLLIMICSLYTKKQFELGTFLNIFQIYLDIYLEIIRIKNKKLHFISSKYLKNRDIEGNHGVLIHFILKGNTMTKMDDLLYCGKSITRKSDRNLLLQSHQHQASQIPWYVFFSMQYL